MPSNLRSSLADAIRVLTIAQIVQASTEVTVIPRGVKRSKSLLLEFLGACSREVQEAIVTVSLFPQHAQRRRNVLFNRRRQTKSHGIPAQDQSPDDLSATQHPPSILADSDVSVDPEFMRVPARPVIDAKMADYIDATSNAALAEGVCAVCARLLGVDELRNVTLDDVPNRHLLTPLKSHRAHVLTDGALLCNTRSNHSNVFNVCDDCWRSLSAKKRPPLALANNMWIGDIPYELSVLTLTERLLVGKYFPAAYIIKMYPKKVGSDGWDRALLNNGVRGNVSTYRLNPEDIVHFMGGTEMPPRPEILAATIGVTIVGRGGKKEGTLPACLRVKRGRVRAALVWLKYNNPLYANMEISEERLSLLPENAVPSQVKEVVRYCDDIDFAEGEGSGYVPSQDPGEELSANCNASGVLDVEMAMDEEDAMEEDSFDARVFPMSSHGVVDVSGTAVPEADIIAHGLSNLTGDQPPDLVIRRSSAFVNEYAREDKATGLRTDGGPSDANHLMGCFPVLFPYGQGGFETERPVDVSYEKHSAWALQYHDKRFRGDYYFMFMVFGVIQKRQVCRATTLQMKKSTFIQNERLLAQVTPADLKRASGEESRRVPFTNPAVQALRSNVTSVRAKVQGTDESRHSIRAQIWSNTVVFNPPSIWLTLNPADTHSPIAQVLTGQEIDLDNFHVDDGPDSNARAINIASDPFAAANFFRKTVQLVLEGLFGIKGASRNRHVHREPGILGTVNAYVGTVEAQGRGTLHLHMILWLKGAPTADRMKAALQTEEFRQRISEYIGNTIRADLDGADGAAVLAIDKVPQVSYARPLDPRKPDYIVKLQSRERALARTLQVHTCAKNSCRFEKSGVLGRCTRRAPFELSETDSIDPSGLWRPVRTYGYLNNWNPWIIQAVMSNHDMKLITNGGDTKDISFYITNYTGKKQLKTSNSSAVLAVRVRTHTRQERRNGDITDVNRKLLIRCANTLTREREFSAPEVATYIMGWGDRYLSHQYVPIYWDSAIAALRLTFSRFRRRSEFTIDADDLPGPEASADNGDSVRLHMANGRLTVRDQLKEYADRGAELEDTSLLQFFLSTYDAPAVPDKGNPPEEVGPIRGRRPNTRVSYTPASGRNGRCRVLRSDGHEMVPHFIGKWFPRNDDADTAEFYSANILMLLKPWRQISELCAIDGSFQTQRIHCLDRDPESVRIMQNIQYYYECSDAAVRRRAVLEPDRSLPQHDMLDSSEDTVLEENLPEAPEHQFSEQDVEDARQASWPYREIRFGEAAVTIGEDSKIFDFDGPTAAVKAGARVADFDRYTQMGEWEIHLRNINRKPDHLPPPVPPVSTGIGPGVCHPQTPDAIETDVDLSFLKADQRRAHDIISSHLSQTLAGKAPKQLLMIVQGQGGTGKSTLIAKISETFTSKGAIKWLSKTATTGVAASLIEGQTLHSWAGIPRGGGLKTPGKATRDKRARNIGVTRYLIIDEYSMLTKEVLCMLCHILGLYFNDEDNADSSNAFGNVNIILFGDPHQFPPVGNAKAALYNPTSANVHQSMGRSLYEQFTVVVNLREQVRVTDVTWNSLLQRLRTGDCSQSDLATLRSLVVTNPECDLPNFTSPAWLDAVLITSRHGVREQWNMAALARHCRSSGQRAYRFIAEDRKVTGDDPLTMGQRVAIAGMRPKETGHLEGDLHLSVGMKIMVTLNIATDADLANGARGVIEDIILDGRDQILCDTSTDGVTTLYHPPAAVLFRPNHATFPPFEGLPPGVIPIFPSEATFLLKSATGPAVKISRRQMSLTGAYAFTDYKSQGQTLEHVIVDLGKPPCGGLTPFNAYVALSRSRGRSTIRLLRDFDDTLFTRHPSDALEEEDTRLNGLESRTTAMFNSDIGVD